MLQRGCSRTLDACLHIEDYGARTALRQRTCYRYEQVREYLRATIQQIYVPTMPEVLRKKGMDVLLGATRFLDPHTLEVGAQWIKAKKILICTGATPRIPALPGLAETPFLHISKSSTMTGCHNEC